MARLVLHAEIHPVQPAPVPNDSYSTAEVARRLNVSVPTIQRWVDSGHLRAWKTMGGHRRIDAASVEALLKSQSGPAAAEQAPASQLRVMIVDDNIDDRDVLCALVLASLPSAEITTAENGFEALLAVGQAQPDVMVTDIVMPHMNGVEMLRHLMADPASKPRVTIAVSSQPPAELATLGSFPEGVIFIPKPIDPESFIRLLQRAVAAIAPSQVPAAKLP